MFFEMTKNKSRNVFNFGLDLLNQRTECSNSSSPNQTAGAGPDISCKMAQSKG